MQTNILTLRLDEASQRYFEGLRQLHFPAARNFIAAHVTLFHSLPDDPSVWLELERLAQTKSRLSAEVTGLRSLGKGVAFTLASPVLQGVHAGLANAFSPWLSAQDRQKFMPHVVVQNKVPAEAARALLESLRWSFMRKQVEACGVDLWEYLGGPWRHLETYRFLGHPRQALVRSSMEPPAESCQRSDEYRGRRLR